MTKPSPPIPEETLRSVQAAYGQGNPYIRIGDQFEYFLVGAGWGLLINHVQREWFTPMLALVTAFQFLEHLPDSQALEALRVRTDWKYALHLPMQHLDLPPGALCEFRRMPCQTSRRSVPWTSF